MLLKQAPDHLANRVSIWNTDQMEPGLCIHSSTAYTSSLVSVRAGPAATEADEAAPMWEVDWDDEDVKDDLHAKIKAELSNSMKS